MPKKKKVIFNTSLQVVACGPKHQFCWWRDAIRRWILRCKKGSQIVHYADCSHFEWSGEVAQRTLKFANGHQMIIWNSSRRRFRAGNSRRIRQGFKYGTTTTVKHVVSFQTLPLTPVTSIRR
ncbi:hypothetical protein Mp_3g08930 [Marchantia polymorpha subsp. ruderalis]|uniref:Uncharacterized protein n=2 Tax=Marchantia polymorpha TaxID=3197 RepID=A0AAF6AYV5_MARPO|nr:hypothetical protein MARPO_0105s0024 [Marchantia polymorpha]BBN04939.1 hypothetical protein Mp_3g08930 [Marchantia polymorpha subsp. ruderalis]|eukprot:PTQ31905.1 hypothetical protein MARPO_0105s0024 [Marchantia polymorpha]